MKASETKMEDFLASNKTQFVIRYTKGCINPQ